MQAEKSAFFIYQTSVMPLLGGKGTGLPRIRVKAAAGRSAERKSSRCAPVFSFANLDTKGNPGNERTCKIGKNRSRRDNHTLIKTTRT